MNSVRLAQVLEVDGISCDPIVPRVLCNHYTTRRNRVTLGLNSSRHTDTRFGLPLVIGARVDPTHANMVNIVKYAAEQAAKAARDAGVRLRSPAVRNA